MKSKTRRSLLVGAPVVAAAALAGALVPTFASGSSHREAPAISQDPTVDSTDVYAFRSPDRPDTATLIANYLPMQEPAGGPNFYRFDDKAKYDIVIDNTGDGRGDITYRFRFKTRINTPGQLVINENISRALRARASATVKRFRALTGGNLAEGATLAGREVYPGLLAIGAKPPSVDAPAAALEIGALPPRIPIRPNAATVKKQQQRSQGSIILANRALDAITGGLTEANFAPGSMGSDWI